MNNTFSLQEKGRTGNLDANSISKQNKLNLIADIMRVTYENPKVRQSELANRLGFSSSTLQRYRNDINMVSPYRINPNNTNKRVKNASNTKFNNDSHHGSDVKRPQMTSNDFKTAQTNTKSIKKSKNVLKGGSI